MQNSSVALGVLEEHLLSSLENSLANLRTWMRFSLVASSQPPPTVLAPLAMRG